MIEQSGKNERRPLRELPRRIAITGAIAVVASIAVTTLLLWRIAGQNASLRIEAIKTGLSVGAGTGGAFALLLAFRRQWLSERTQAHAEDVARENADDAIQRRVTELYGKAVEQLGHDQAAVRLGGLYSLERLAQDHPEHRHTVTDVIFAYLRMPFNPPPGDSPAPPADSTRTSTAEHPPASDPIRYPRQELQVRLTAQRLLARHLTIQTDSSTPPAPATYPSTHWHDTRIDLTGALLIDLDFSGCQLHHSDFRDAQFTGHTRFDGAQFTGHTRFDGAQFTGETRFDKAQFTGPALFSEAQFTGPALFSEAQFTGTAGFVKTQFTGPVAWFINARFTETALFIMAQFTRPAAGFNNAQFTGDALFDAAQFTGDAGFNNAQFTGDARFNNAQFTGPARFDNAGFGRKPTFDEATAAVNPAGEHMWPIGWRIEPSSPRSETGRLVETTT